MTEWRCRFAGGTVFVAVAVVDGGEVATCLWPKKWAAGKGCPKGGDSQLKSGQGGIE